MQDVKLVPGARSKGAAPDPTGTVTRQYRLLAEGFDVFKLPDGLRHASHGARSWSCVATAS